MLYIGLFWLGAEPKLNFSIKKHAVIGFIIHYFVSTKKYQLTDWDLKNIVVIFFFYTLSAENIENEGFD